jgi:hypothetical protein
VIAYSETGLIRNKIYNDPNSPTNSTYSSWDDGDYYETQTYYGNRPDPVEELKTKWHTFCYWLNRILDPPEEPVLPPEEPPPKKPKVIKYAIVKLARAPPWLFLYNVSANV